VRRYCNPGPTILDDEQENQLERTMRADPSPFVLYSSLSPARKAWIRRVHTVSGLLAVSAGVCTLVLPTIFGTIDFWPSLAIGIFCWLVSSELVKIVATESLRSSILVTLVNGVFWAHGIYNLFYFYPDIAFKSAVVSIVVFASMVATAHKYVEQDIVQGKKVFEILLPAMAASSAVACILPPYNVMLLLPTLALTNVFAYNTWKSIQRTFMFGKHDPSIPDLDFRLTRRSASHVLWPFWLMMLMILLHTYDEDVIAGWYNNFNKQR